MGYTLHDETPEPAPMRCEILMTTGAEAKVDIEVIGAQGERRPPSVEEFYQIVKSLAKHQFNLKSP